MSDVTQILSEIERGDLQAAEQLLPLVYDELRRLAATKLAHERPGQTLQTTALVHEAYVRLAGNDVQQHWNSRGHFFAAAAEAMRRILVENARRKARIKRGGDLVRHTIDQAEIADTAPPQEILVVHAALDQFAVAEPLAAQLVKLHYFVGLPLDEAAPLVGMSRATAYRTWTYARAWLKAALADDSAAK